MATVEMFRYVSVSDDKGPVDVSMWYFIRQ